MFGGKYKSFFNDPTSNKDDKKQDVEENRREDYNEPDDVKSRSITGIAWNKERYIFKEI